MSIRYKIAILFAVLASFILTAVALAVYWFSVKERVDFFRLRLKNRAISIAQIAASVSDSNYTIIKKLDATSLTTFADKSVTVIDYRNNILYKHSDISGHNIILSADQIEAAKINTTYFFASDKRTAVAVHYLNEDANLIALMAAYDLDGETYLNDLKNLLLLAVMLSVIVSFITGLFFANTLVNPIGRIIHEVRLISSNNLSRRIPERTTKDELYQLSQTFNELLDRLQESFIIQRRFISNASHELSTPLTSVSSQLEVALQKERTVEEYREVLKSIHEDVKDLHLLTRSLLDIAKTGTEGSIELSPVRIDEVLLKAASDIQKSNSSCRVSINFETIPDDEEALTVFGNSNLLYISFKNLMENGCKYSHDQHTIVTTSFSKSVIAVDFQSNGELIEKEEQPYIFQPFYRAEKVQHKEGFGLGLTLVKRILSLHKATIEVSSTKETGTIFKVQLPAATLLKKI
ncbi:HAMP domain-containing sensor histidine kinase [Lacibacter sp. MH-610]|uniref:ATP-binding protein n=1 Tax=Lacibacter sp. MH-610 TaxID=3020883 RepID=UPI003891C404